MSGVTTPVLSQKVKSTNTVNNCTCAVTVSFINLNSRTLRLVPIKIHLALLAGPRFASTSISVGLNHPSTLHKNFVLIVSSKMASVASSQPVPLDTVPISPDNTTSTGDSDNSIAMDDGSLTTVFHNPEHFNVKHPLMHTWTLWFTKPPSGKVPLTHHMK